MALDAARWFALLTMLGASALTTSAAGANDMPAVRHDEYVVVLHGLARSGRSMEPLAQRIAAAGYQVFNLNYPSRNLPPGGLVTVLREALKECCAGARGVNFVTHSLGGIVVRAYLAESDDPRVHRIVMLSPPNQGSELVDLLGDTWLFRTVMGPTAVQLGTGPESLPNRLPRPHFELGVIAATGSVNPAGSAAIPGEDDGIVSFCSMWTEGVRDIVTVPDSHAFVMRSPEVARQTLRFLAEGRFDHGEEDEAQALLDACRSAAGPDGESAVSSKAPDRIAPWSD